MDTNRQKLGEKIKNAIKQSSKSRKEIAAEMGISEANIYKLYQVSDTKVLTLIKLAEVTGNPLSFFIDLEDNEKVQALENELNHVKQARQNLKNSIMTHQLIMNEAYGILDKLMDSKGNQITFTQLERDRRKEIPLSHFLKLMSNLSLRMAEPDSGGERTIQLWNKLLNIVEYREIYLEYIMPEENMGI